MLNFLIDEEAWNGLPDPVKAEYKKRDSDGKYVLDVSGAVPTEKLTEFRTNNIELQKQLKVFEGVDVAKYNDLVAIEKNLRDGKLKDGKTVAEIVEERVAEMKKAHEKETGTLKQQLELTSSGLEKLTIAEAATRIGTELGLRPTAADDLVGRVRQQFKLKDGRPVAVNEQGAEIYGAGGEPMTIKEYVTGLVEKAPHLFEASQGTGSKGNGGAGGGAGGRPSVNPFAKQTWNLTKQGELYKANPELAKKMAAEHGIKI